MEHLWLPTEIYLLKLPQAAISKAASRLALYSAPPPPCFTRLCVYMGGRWLDAKGRRDLRWETWIWGFDQRPPCETDRQSPAKATHANLQPFYRFSGRLVHPRYIRAGRSEESKWATSREVFLPSSNHPSFVIPHRGLKAHKTNKRCQLSWNFVAKKCPSWFEPS